MALVPKTPTAVLVPAAVLLTDGSAAAESPTTEGARREPSDTVRIAGIVALEVAMTSGTVLAPIAL